jgi:hypothetical protein
MGKSNFSRARPGQIPEVQAGRLPQAGTYQMLIRMVPVAAPNP